MRNHHIGVIISAVLALIIIASGVFLASTSDNTNDQNTQSTDITQTEPKDSSTVRKAQTGQLKNYYVAIGDSGQPGLTIACGDSLIKVDTPEVTYTDMTQAAFNQQLKDHNQYYGQSGLYNPLYLSRLAYRSGIIKGDMLTVNLTGDLKLAGDCDGARIKAQLEGVARSTTNKKNLTIKVNDRDLSTLVDSK